MMFPASGSRPAPADPAYSERMPRDLRQLLCALVLPALLAGAAHARTGAPPLVVDAPPALAADARRVEAINYTRLEEALARAGLTMPSRIHIVLVEEDHPLARDVPPWIVGLASGETDVVIFPSRVVRYPYDSLESVVRHEVAHLALTRQANGGSLPRWFHEGVAVSVDVGFGVGSQLRLLFAMLDRPGVDDLNRLFTAMAQPEAVDAYLLSTALVEDLRRRHGPDVPGAIATQVAAGVPFADAFVRETGVTPDQAAARAWGAYRRWVTWVPAVTSGSAMWVFIMGLALVAYLARLRRRRQRRRRWEQEEEF